MQIIRDITGIQPEPCVASIGFFDGVHRGHRFLIEQVREVARAKGVKSALITFPVHPRMVMKADYKPELLTPYDEKLALLAQIGIDYCIVLNFTPAIARLSAQQFMSDILRDRYNIAGLVIGYDHRFGHNRAEGFDDYCRFGNELGISIARARACTIDGTTISSSVIRRLLHAGNVQLANEYLSYRYFLEGTVTGGHQVGRTLGFPTANLHIERDYKLIPEDGVYAVEVTVDGSTYGGMLNIGRRPTVDNGDDRSIEVHILNFNSNIYNFPLKLSFIKFIRHEMKFSGKEELRNQLEADRLTVEAISRNR